MLPVLVNISRAGEAPFPALLHRERALALAHWRDTQLRHAHAMAALLREWPLYAEALRHVCADPATTGIIERHGVAIAGYQLHAPAAPGQVYCTIGNYQAQLLQAALDAGDGPDGPQAAARQAAAAAAIATRRREGTPYICMKGSACVAGPHDELQVPDDLTTLDWEVEIGVVIGRTAWRVAPDAALDHVAGYCVVNDVTLRAKVFRADPQILGTDWLQSKARPGWLPTGPWLAPAWNIADPGTLELSLRLNGELMQSGHAGDMVFDIAEQISYLSQHTRLEPGDLLCTGSPAGFGSHYGRYLRAGDLVEAGVSGLGVQRVRCVP
ncbi:fumarylacetoacetate hydrolase family protein [Duganella sp. FT92W]|uniref:Fumarylacetoacetate hydrolase family protein n=1 Tax=Pseudoduganella rivuli TaxID=2666085 RepID=A0A7X2IIH2_9BURK|nr:fumarylacetoacetate hydrolase family protein [Pseudoduganella rivuli]MRV70421.1 fumarylacetoacetate hydrolase family protein [Pseudoduganella rivuli]